VTARYAERAVLDRRLARARIQPTLLDLDVREPSAEADWVGTTNAFRFGVPCGDARVAEDRPLGFFSHSARGMLQTLGDPALARGVALAVAEHDAALAGSDRVGYVVWRHEALRC
jgi:hypothetical protein